MIDAHFHHGREKEELTNDCITKINALLEENQITQCLMHVIDEFWREKGWHTIHFGDRIIPSFLLNPLGAQWEEELQLLNEHQIHFVKILPYEQKILRSHYDRVLTMARAIEKYNMCLVICASYGSELLYETNGVELAAYLLRNGITSPIVIAHGGMVKVLDAFSLMEAYPNVWIDLSFAIDYWYGSTVIQDYAYVIKKLTGNRIFYGSDYPYVSLEASQQAFEKMCEEYHIPEDMKERMLHDNFEEFLKENGWC